MVVNIFQSLLKLLPLAPNLLTTSRWQSFRVVGGRQRYFILFPYDKWNDRIVGGLSGSFTVAEIESIPVTQSLTVFEGRYWSLQKFHLCFHIVVHSFWRNFKFGNDRERPLTTIWKPGFIVVKRNPYDIKTSLSSCENVSYSNFQNYLPSDFHIFL